ncbi:MAG: NfeD family protein [Bacilli bacterium]|nr:NfeD family protein [Bacilli bacterium]
MEFTWLIVIIICSFLEMITVSLVSVWFIASAIVALIASLFTDSLLIQMGIFVILGTFLLFTTRKPLQKMVENRKEKTNLDRIFDMTGIVTKNIKKYEPGIVKIDGKEWSAVADKEIQQGSIIKVLSINSTKLKVEKVED